jgi:hypothetical protein
MIQAIRNFLFVRRHMKACRDLQRLVNERCNSFEIESYRRHRKAALRFYRREAN